MFREWAWTLVPFMLGVIVGSYVTFDKVKDMENEALLRGYGQINPVTSEFEWIDVD